MQQPHAPLLETAAGRPSTPPLMNLPALQRVVGNQAVQRMLLRSGPAVIQRRTSFKNVAKLKDDYQNETTSQRPDLVAAVQGLLPPVKKFYTGREALRAADPTDPNAVKTAKETLKPGALFTKIEHLPYDQALAEVTDAHSKHYQKAVRQDIPISESGDLPATFDLSARLVEYDTTPAAQAQTRVDMGGGSLRRNNATHDPVDTANSVTMHSGVGYEIFVVSPSGELHMASHKIGKYHHSSLLGGGNVSMGGELKVAGGQIVELSNKSGHYAPTATHFRQFLHLLQKNGHALNFTLSGWKLGPGGIDIAVTAPVTGAAYLASLGAKETYSFEATSTIYESLVQQYGQAAVNNALFSQGWKANPTGTGMQRADGTPLTDKEVRQFLKAHFAAGGRPRAKETKSTVTTANPTSPPVINWV